MSVVSVDVNLNGTDLSTAVPEALVLDVRRPLVGARRFEQVEVPGRAGAWTFDEEPGPRIIEVDLDLQAPDFETRRAAVRAVADWADIGTHSQLIFSDEPDRYHWAQLANDGDVSERLLYGAATLRFTADPFAYSTTTTTQAATANSNPDTDTFTIGDEVYAEPVIELTPAGGNLTAFVLTVNGYQVTWAGLLASGDTLTISSISDVVTLGANDDINLTGAFDVADLDMADVSAPDGFPLLFSGLNTWTLSWTGSATSVALNFYWRERTR